jgi:hypothetical protein
MASRELPLQGYGVMRWQNGDRYVRQIPKIRTEHEFVNV